MKNYNIVRLLLQFITMHWQFYFSLQCNSDVSLRMIFKCLQISQCYSFKTGLIAVLLSSILKLTIDISNWWPVFIHHGSIKWKGIKMLLRWVQWHQTQDSNLCPEFNINWSKTHNRYIYIIMLMVQYKLSCITYATT